MTQKGLALLAICVLLLGCEENDGDRFGHPPTLQSVYAYLAGTPYEDVLVPCVTASEDHQSCAVATLPPIAMNTPEPAIADIMERVVVSHDWMGERFEQLLYELPEDLHTLFGGVSAVVIGSEIRPSFYSRLTGAIYLDPYHLWLTQEEKNVISRKADYRAAFAEPLSFRAVWRTTREGERAATDSGFANTGTRQIEEIVIPIASLLFHELAHANDILPPHLYAQVDVTDSIYDAAGALESQYPSSLLNDSQPLTSDTLFRLADILYKGATPNNTDKQMTAVEVGTHFYPDKASDDYAYTSQYEDFAMLFEEAMMKIHFDVDRDMAFVDAPANPTSCMDYTIGWGVRNRIGEPQVLERAAWTIEMLLPHQDYTAQLATFPAPTDLPVGVGWCATATFNDVLLSKPGGLYPAKQPVMYPGDLLPPYDLIH